MKTYEIRAEAQTGRFLVLEFDRGNLVAVRGSFPTYYNARAFMSYWSVSGNYN